MPGTVPDQCVSETTKVFAFVVLKHYKLGEGRRDNTESSWVKVNDLALWKGTHVTGDKKEQYKGNYLCECGYVCGGVLESHWQFLNSQGESHWGQ